MAAKWWLVAIGCLVLSGGAEAGLNASWIYPTPGCAAQGACNLEAVCQPSYLKVDLGETLRFTIAATNPTPPGTLEATRHCNFMLGNGESCAYVNVSMTMGRPSDDGKPCCGFSEVFGKPLIFDPYGVKDPSTFEMDGETLVPSYMEAEDVPGSIQVVEAYPTMRNVTIVEFEYNASDPETANPAMPPPLYNVSFTASYANLLNVSACRKNIFVRVCSAPFWDVEPKHSSAAIVGSPAFGVMAEEGCGEIPCAHTPGTLDEAMGVIILDMGLAPSLGVRAGQVINFTMSASTIQHGDHVMLDVMQDPGLPIGMDVGDFYTCGLNKVCRDAVWTPSKTQVGEHFAYIRGTSSSSAPPEENPCDPKTSPTLALRFNVYNPTTMWIDPVTHVDDMAVVGTTYMKHFMCRSDYTPLVRVVGDMQGAMLRLVSMQDEGNFVRTATFEFSWEPLRGNEGFMKHWQIECVDDQLVGEGANVIDLRVTTKLCEYTVMPEDTLGTLARRYHLSTNWLNIWNANPTLIQDPDSDLDPGLVVRVGPLYNARHGDTLSNVAAQFSTTVKKLLSVNPHISEKNMPPEMELLGGMSAEGLQMCVLTCTSFPSPSLTYKWAY